MYIYIYIYTCFWVCIHILTSATVSVVFRRSVASRSAWELERPLWNWRIATWFSRVQASPSTRLLFTWLEEKPLEADYGRWTGPLMMLMVDMERNSKVLPFAFFPSIFSSSFAFVSVMSILPPCYANFGRDERHKMINSHSEHHCDSWVLMFFPLLQIWACGEDTGVLKTWFLWFLPI